MKMIRLCKTWPPGGHKEAFCLIPFGNRMGLYTITDAGIIRHKKRVLFRRSCMFGQAHITERDLVYGSLAYDPFFADIKEPDCSKMKMSSFRKTWARIMEEIPQEALQEILRWNPAARAPIWYGLAYAGDAFLQLCKRTPLLAYGAALNCKSPKHLRKILKGTELQILISVRNPSGAPPFFTEQLQQQAESNVELLRMMQRRHCSLFGYLMGVDDRTAATLVENKSFRKFLHSRRGTMPAIWEVIRCTQNLDIDQINPDKIIDWLTSVDIPTDPDSTMMPDPNIVVMLYRFLDHLRYEEVAQLSHDVWTHGKWGTSIIDAPLPQTRDDISHVSKLAGFKIYRPRSLSSLVEATSQSMKHNVLGFTNAMMVNRALDGEYIPYVIEVGALVYWFPKKIVVYVKDRTIVWTSWVPLTTAVQDGMACLVESFAPWSADKELTKDLTHRLSRAIITMAIALATKTRDSITGRQHVAVG